MLNSMSFYEQFCQIIRFDLIHLVSPSNYNQLNYKPALQLHSLIEEPEV